MSYDEGHSWPRAQSLVVLNNCHWSAQTINIQPPELKQFHTTVYYEKHFILQSNILMTLDFKRGRYKRDVLFLDLFKFNFYF